MPKVPLRFRVATVVGWSVLLGWLYSNGLRAEPSGHCVSITPPEISFAADGSIGASVGVSASYWDSVVNFCPGNNVWNIDVRGPFGDCALQIEQGHITRVQSQVCGLSCVHVAGVGTELDYNSSNGSLNCTFNERGRLRHLDIALDRTNANQGCQVSAGLSYDELVGTTASVGATFSCGLGMMFQWNPKGSWECVAAGDFSW